MNPKGLFFSANTLPGAWASTVPLAEMYGPKGAALTTLPRRWTPEFVLFPCDLISIGPERALEKLNASDLQRLEGFLEGYGEYILRSSIIGETIWQRGTYESVVLPQFDSESWRGDFIDAAKSVVSSAADKAVALVLQEFRRPVFQGEFGNLLRLSKTRDHWEISTVAHATATQHKTSVNTQRDIAADPHKPLSGGMKPSSPRMLISTQK